YLQMLIDVTAAEGIPVVTGPVLCDVDWPFQEAVKSSCTPDQPLRIDLPTKVVLWRSRPHAVGEPGNRGAGIIIDPNKVAEFPLGHRGGSAEGPAKLPEKKSPGN